MFGHAAQGEVPSLRRAVAGWSQLHGEKYDQDLPAWLFALHTLLALVARLATARALRIAAGSSEDSSPLRDRLADVESGALFLRAGASGLGGGPFGWYLDDWCWSELQAPIGALVDRMHRDGIGASRGETPHAGGTIHDLYCEIVPREVRHALGEVYTPRWLVAHTLDALRWDPREDLLDPTCGMGVFLLEAVRRRLQFAEREGIVLTAENALRGLHGIEINPLAVIAARAALVSLLAGRFDPATPVCPPVRHGDAIVLASCETSTERREDPFGGMNQGLQAIPKVRYLAGNPPWVKWSQLPREYAAFIKPRCAAVPVFGKDRYVGGIEADVAAVITHLAAQRWLAPGGHLGFLLTGTLFSSEAGAGFRRFEYANGTPLCAIRRVEDFRQSNPFDGVKTHTTLLLAQEGETTRYPIPYEVWPSSAPQHLAGTCPQGSTSVCTPQRLLACPVPGTVDGPWLKGTAEEHALWRVLLDAAAPSAYRARKGVTTDCNGVYFVRVIGVREGLIEVENEPTLGRRADVPRVRGMIEPVHLHPLLRGRGLEKLRVTCDPDFCILVPQRSMHGDPSLPTTAPRTWEFLRAFEGILQERGSYRRYQQGKPFWSTWSTGPYTFNPYKVLWKEMSGGRFCAAAIGTLDHPHLGMRAAVPDHKLYFVPVGTPEEADFLAGILNAPSVSSAVSAYAAQLSLGVSVVENLRIPRFDPSNPGHQTIAASARCLREGSLPIDERSLEVLDRAVLPVVAPAWPVEATPTRS